MKKMLVTLFLAFLTLAVYPQSSPTTDPIVITPPLEMQHFAILDSGEEVIYFTRDEWMELSRLLWEERVTTAEEAVKEAVVPLIAQNEVLERESRENKIYKYGMFGAFSLALGATIWALVK